MADKTIEMNLIFSGNSVIKVFTEVIEVTLDDQGDPGKQNLNQNITCTVIKELNANSYKFKNILVNLLIKEK